MIVVIGLGAYIQGALIFYVCLLWCLVQIHFKLFYSNFVCIYTCSSSSSSSNNCSSKEATVVLKVPVVEHEEVEL